MVEEWVKDARNEVRVKANLHAKAKRALGATQQKNQQLNTKLTTEERARKSAEVGLQNAQDQAEDQRKKLYHIEIKLTTQKQLVLGLKAELQKANEAAQTAKEAVEALEQASYDRGVQETKIRLSEELEEVCRDYSKEVWAEALNPARVPAPSEGRNAENVFYPEDIREVPMVLPPPVALAFPPSEQPSTTQTFLLLPEVSKEPGKVGD